MPTPSPTPTAEELSKLKPIFEKDSHAEVTEIVSAASTQAESDADWALTLADLTKLGSLKSQRSNLKRVEGVVEFFEGGSGEDKLEAINDIRTRYGLTELFTLEPQIRIDTTLAYF